MRHLLRKLLCGGLLLAGASERASAFSLLGAFDAWQVAEIGYQLPFDIGGPMNLGEEYRLTTPLITYGFDESFLNYFGTKGVEEIGKAIKVLQDLPPFSQMSAGLSEYPLDTRRFNHRANALYLNDLRSFTLGAFLEEFGLAAPERYAWTLRSRVVINNIPWYVVLRRNFDPITFQPSTYVNGHLYTYIILQTYTTPTWEAVEFDVDPSLPTVSSVAAAGLNGGTVLASGVYASFEPGMFYTGLTRDDIGGLRYIYRPQNVNVEVLGTNAVLAPLGSSGGNTIIGPGSWSPWGAPPGLIFGTNVTGGVTTNVALPPVDPALRPGIDKFNFLRVDYDSMTGNWVVLTNRYEDHYVSNGVQRVQIVERTLAQPDILFSAADLGIDPDGLPFIFRRTFPWLNNDAINGSETLAGPGQIVFPIVMTFSKIGQYLINSGDGGEVDGFPLFWWGSYDGTTNEPVVYPLGASIKALERLVMSGKGQELVSPWRSP